MLNRELKNKFYSGLFKLSAYFIISAVVFMISYIFFNAIRKFDYHLIFSLDENGLIIKIIVTLFVVLLTLFFALPISTLVAIYISEYSKKGLFLTVFNNLVNILSSIPSIIFGIFGYLIFCVMFKFGVSIISGILTLTLMILPTLIISIYDQLRLVPYNIREASYGIGASRGYTVWKVVIPYAKNGIINAIILAVGKISGESAALNLVMGTVFDPPVSLFDSGRTLATHMLKVINSDILSAEQVNQTMFLTSAVLLTISLVSILLSKKVKIGSK